MIQLSNSFILNLRFKIENPIDLQNRSKCFICNQISKIPGRETD